MTMVVTINGTDRTAYIEAGSITISETSDGRNTMMFSTIDRTGSFLVSEGWEIVVTDTEGTVFGGYINDVDEETTRQPSGTRFVRCTCQANDYNELVDRHLAVEVWDDTAAGDVVQDLVDTYLAQDGVFGRHYESVINSAPAVYWTLDEPSGTTATDHVNSYDGTYTNGAVPATAGSPIDEYTPATCGTVDASNDSVSVADAAGLKPSTSAFAWAGWIRRSSTSAVGVVASKKSSTGATQGWAVYFDASDNLAFQRHDGAAASTQSYAASALLDGEWHYIVAGWDGSASFLIVDDAAKGTPSATSRDVDNTQAYRVGNTGGSAEGMDGDIAHAAYWVGTIPTTDEFSLLYASGVSNPISDGFTLSRVLANYKPVGETLNYLRDVTALTWNIDYKKQMRFHDLDAMPAPIALDDDGDTFTTVRVKKHRDQYRNVEYLRGGLYRSDSRTETFSGDDETQTFLTAYPLDAVPTITLNTGGGPTAQTVGIKGVDTGKDWYWNRGEDTIVQEDGDTPISNTDVLSVTYYGLSPLLANSRLEDEILARAALDGTSGIVEHMTEDASIDDQDMAVERATGLLRRYGQSATQIEFETNSSVSAACVTLAAGQVIPVSLTAHSLSDQFYIESVNKTYRSEDDVMVVTGTAVQAEGIGSWVEFFRKLYERSSKEDVKDSEILLRLRDFRGTVAITDTETVTDSAVAEAIVGEAIVGFSEIRS